MQCSVGREKIIIIKKKGKASAGIFPTASGAAPCVGNGVPVLLYTAAAAADELADVEKR